jgi:translocation and assembly module TamB
MKGFGHVRVHPDGVLARVDQAQYAGGTLQATIGVSRLKNPPLPIRISISGRGMDFEQFFADLGLHGTGLMARADLDAVLSFEKGGIENADGAARLTLTPDPSRLSAVSGRHAIPIGGGGPLLVRAGRIVFPSLLMQTQNGLAITLDGTLPFEDWTPDLNLTIEAPDLKEAERLAENFYPAIKKEPLLPPLNLGGSGTLIGSLERSFADPLVTGTLTAKDFVLKKVRFGEATASFTVDHNVLTLDPFHARDAGGEMKLTGQLGWGGKLGHQYLLEDMQLVTDGWQLKRILDFLSFDLPMDARVTGTLPLQGVTPDVYGSGALAFKSAHLWGQPFDEIRGVLGLEGDQLRFSGVDALLGGGSVRGSGIYRYDGAYEFDAEMCHFPAHQLATLSSSVSGLEAYADGRVSGKGTLERPGLSIDLTVPDPKYGGEPLTAKNTPAELKFSLDSSGARGRLSAGDLYNVSLKRAAGSPDSVPYRLDVEVTALGPLRGALGFPDSAAQFDGALSGHAEIFIPDREDLGSWLQGAIDKAHLTGPGRRVDLVKPAVFEWKDDVLTLGEIRLMDRSLNAAPGFVPAQVSISGTVMTAPPGYLAMESKADFDAAYLKALGADLQVSGPVGLNLKVGGTTSRPELEGRVYLKGLEYSPGPNSTPVKAITGTLNFQPGRLSSEDISLYYDGGVRLSGSVGLDGLTPTTIRLNASISGMKAAPFPGFRSVVSGDLVLLGEEGTIRTARGDLRLDSGVYDADLDLSLTRIFSAFGPSGITSRTPTRFDSIDLDVRVAVPPASIEIRNNVARMRASGDLTARGTFGRPLLFGQLEVEDGGKLTLRGLRYDVVTAKLLFSNPFRIDPNFELEASTQVGAYQLTLGLTGTLNRFTPRFRSDPPMSEAQVVSTLTTGKAPDSASYASPGSSSPISSDESIATAARNLIAGLATDAAASRTRELFKLDRLQIDPVFAGSTFEATRLTVAKTIAKDITLTYSFKSSTSLQQIILVEYQVSRDAFLQFIRDETGIYSVEIKIRQRLR